MNKQLTRILSVSALLLLTGTALVATSSAGANPSVAINLSNDSYNATYPNIQNLGSNVYAVWSELSHGIWFRYSIDNGSTWSMADRLSPTGGVAQFPLMTANGSYVYVVWAQSLNNIQQVYFTYSNNSGVSFAAAKIVDNTPNTTDITPVLASYGQDVYIAYDCGGASCVTASTNNGQTFNTPHQYASGPEPQLAAYGDNVYAVSDSFNRGASSITVSHNQGATWKSLSVTNGGGAEPWVSADGPNVLVAWETKNTDSVVKVSVSTNSGTSFSAANVISTSTPDAWAPMTSVVGNNFYVAYRTYPGSANSQEYFSMSTGGGTWSTPLAIGMAGRDNSWPVTVAANPQAIFVAWYLKTGTLSTSPWEAVGVESTDGGTSFTSPIVFGPSLDESDVATQAISSNGQTMFMVWANTSSTGKQQVYFNSYASSDVTTTSSSSTSTTTSITTSTISTTTTTTTTSAQTRQMFVNPDPLIHGQNFTLTGVGFQANVELTFNWNSTFSTLTGSTMTNSTGGFTTILLAPTPKVLGTTHTLYAYEGTSKELQINVVIS